MKNETQETSLWSKMSFCNQKQRFESLILIYVMTLGVLWTLDGFLENVIQLGWLGMPTKSFLSLLKELEIEYIIDHDSSWMNIISNSLCASKIVLVSRLFLWMF